MTAGDRQTLLFPACARADDAARMSGQTAAALDAALPALRAAGVDVAGLERAVMLAAESKKLMAECHTLVMTAAVAKR